MGPIIYTENRCRMSYFEQKVSQNQLFFDTFCNIFNFIQYELKQKGGMAPVSLGSATAYKKVKFYLECPT